MGHCLSNLHSNIIMNTFVVFAGLLALAAGRPQEIVGNLAPTLIRAPAHDSASIESHRLGGNFAYAVAEAHAYAQVTPQVSTITHPVAETTVVHEPTPIAHVTPGKVITTKHIPQPIIEHQPIFAQEPVVQAKTIVHQPLYKTRTVTQHVAQPIAHHVVPSPAVAVKAAPVEVAAAPVAVPHHLGYHGYAHPGYGYGLNAYGNAWAPAAVPAKVIAPVEA